MEILNFIYSGHHVDFKKTDKDFFMVNGTQLAETKDKLVANFMRLNSTEQFLTSCLLRAQKNREIISLNKNKGHNKETNNNNKNSDLNLFAKYKYQISKNSDLKNVFSRDDLVTSTQNMGTWMHRIVALRFAAWLDPDLEVWIYETMDYLLNRFYREQQAAMVAKVQARERKKDLKVELLKNHSDIPEVREYFELENAEKEAEKKRAVSVKKQYQQLSLDFNFEKIIKTN